MNHIMKKTAVWMIGGLLTLPAYGVAAPVINETWSGYANGVAPGAPWTLASLTDPGDQDSITVQNGWVLIDNTGTASNDWNPNLVYDFAQATTNSLNISFDYRIPAAYGGSQIDFMLKDGTGKTAVDVILGHNWTVNGISYRVGSDYHGVGHTFTASETVHISLTNINLTTHTFDLAWSSSEGTNGSVAGAGFRDNAAANFSEIRFGDNSSATTTSQIYLDNITVSTVPEPAAGSFVVGVVSATLVVGQRRRALRRP